jgi:hypothetical protein
MAWLIMNDEVDYTCIWYPTHIISKDKKLLPVFIGASQSLINGLVGIYIKNEDYNKIRHDKVYILIHNPEAQDDEIENIEWEKVPDVKNQKTTGREHIHLLSEPEFEGIKI